MASSAAGDLVVKLREALKSHRKEPDSNFSATLVSFLKTSNKTSRIKLLANYFCIGNALPPDDAPYPGEYDGASLLLELLEGALVFVLEKGFTYSEAYIFVCLYVSSLELIRDTTQTSDDSLAMEVVAVIEEFKKVTVTYSILMPHTKLLISAQYIKDTVFRHYRLYHILLTENQPVDYTKVTVNVDVPESPAPLIDGLEEAEWTKKEKIKELEVEQSLRKRELVAAYELTQQEADISVKKVYKDAVDRVSDGATMTETAVSEIIESLVKAHLESTKTAISHSLQIHELDVQLRMDKVEILSPKREQSLKASSPKKGKKTPSGRTSKKT